jgi:hypothetical protein
MSLLALALDGCSDDSTDLPKKLPSDASLSDSTLQKDASPKDGGADADAARVVDAPDKETSADADAGVPDVSATDATDATAVDGSPDSDATNTDGSSDSDASATDAAPDSTTPAVDGSPDSDATKADGSLPDVSADSPSDAPEAEFPTAPSPPSPEHVGSSVGDPHLQTFDGVKYDLQAVGEFTLVRDPRDGMLVQIRTEPWSTSKVVTINTAVAAHVGSDTLGFYVDGRVRLNGKDAGFVAGKNLLPGGGSVHRSSANYAIVWPDGSQARVYKNQSHITVQVYLASGRRSHVVGLLGNFDDDVDSDLQTKRNLTVESRTNFATFYDVFAKSWRIAQPDSLFEYASGQSTATFTDVTFPRTPATFPAISLDELIKVQTNCSKAGVAPSWIESCILDVGTSGDQSFAVELARTRPPTLNFNVTPPPSLAPARDAGAGAPKITSVVTRLEQTGPGQVFVSEIGVQDADGDVNAIHYEIIEQSSNKVAPADLAVTPGNEQKTGITVTSSWTCGTTDPYYVTLRLTAVDAQGIVSRAWDVAIPCND